MLKMDAQLTSTAVLEHHKHLLAECDTLAVSKPAKATKCLGYSQVPQVKGQLAKPESLFASSFWVLNAPADESEPEFLICNPPRHMIVAGVVPARIRWRVTGALYGYPLLGLGRSTGIGF